MASGTQTRSDQRELAGVSGWSALVVDDDAGVRQSIRLCLEAAGARVLGVGAVPGALDAVERAPYDVIFLDLWLGAASGLDAIPDILRRQPDAGIIVITAFATFENAVEAMRRGAVDYLPKPFTPEQVRLAARRVVDAKRLRHRVDELEQRLATTDVTALFETRSPAFRSFLQVAERAADSEAVVLLRGESGTGKNVFAAWLTERSPRRDRPFVSVNCPALAGDLIVSALFGHRRGAFTGAVADAVGKVQEAEGGTLFLDEVGDLSAEAQVRLLRFLNDHSYERLGEPRERRADVRVIAATNRDLDVEMRAGRFREDLFYRLNVVSLAVPSLRERPEDILLLARHFLAFFAARQQRSGLAFAAAAESALVHHSWPGNLRQLRNAIERAVILAPASVIETADLGLTSGDTDRTKIGRRIEIGQSISLAELEREHIARIVSESATLDAAARTLGIDPTTLQRKRKRYGLA